MIKTKKQQKSHENQIKKKVKRKIKMHQNVLLVLASVILEITFYSP